MVGSFGFERPILRLEELVRRQRLLERRLVALLVVQEQLGLPLLELRLLELLLKPRLLL